MCANGVNDKFRRGIKYFRGVQIFQVKVDRGSTFWGGPNISLQDNQRSPTYIDLIHLEQQAPSDVTRSHTRVHIYHDDSVSDAILSSKTG